MKHKDKCVTEAHPLALRYVVKEVTLYCEAESKLMQGSKKMFTRGMWRLIYLQKSQVKNCKIYKGPNYIMYVIPFENSDPSYIILSRLQEYKNQIIVT